MKNLYSALGIVLAVSLSIISCTNDPLAPAEKVSGEGVPFEISTLITKTSNDGLDTKWAAEDQINLFHAEAGTTTYVNDKSFTVDEGLAGNFSGTLTSALTDGKSYDWYANYPYVSQKTSPAIKTAGNVTVGGTAQTQTGNDSKAHLSGTACPLYGIAKDVAAADKPAIVMKNLASVVAVKVTNTLDDALTVTSVAVTSTEDIVGTYYIDYSGDAPAYTASDDKYVSSTANLTVSGGTAIAKNASATFYIAIKPHTVKSGSNLVIAVNGIEKTLTLPKDVTFTAGSIKTIGYKYDYVKIATNDDEITFATTGVKATTSSGATYSSWSGKKGSVSDAVYAGFSAGGVKDSPSVQLRTKNSNEGIISTTSGGKIKKVSVTWNTNTKSGRILNVYGSNTVYSAVSDLYDSSKQGTLIGTIVYGTSTELIINSDYAYIGLRSSSDVIYLDKITISWDASGVSKDPIIVAGDVTGVSARGLSAEELTFSITNPVEGTSISATCDGTVVTEVEADSGTIHYSVAENTTGEAREGKITLTYGSVTKEVKVSQNADTFESTVTEIVLDATSGSQKTFTVTSDFDWTASYTGSGFKVSPAKYAWTEGGKQTVTVTATADNASESGTIGLGTLQFANGKTGKQITVAIKQKSSYVAVTGKASILTLSSTNKFGTTSGSTLAADDKTVWTVTTTGSNKTIQGTYSSDYNGQQFGTTNKPWTGTFSADFTGKTVTKIEIVANTGSAATVSATVGDKAFGEAVSVAKQLNKEITYSFTGSAAGKVVLTVSSTSKAFYLGRIIVTYE